MSSSSPLHPHAEGVEEELEGHGSAPGQRALVENAGGGTGAPSASSPTPTPTSSPTRPETRRPTPGGGWLSFWGRGATTPGEVANGTLDAAVAEGRLRPSWDVTDEGAISDAERRRIDLATTRELRERQLAETIALERQHDEAIEDMRLRERQHDEIMEDMRAREHWRLVDEQEQRLARQHEARASASIGANTLPPRSTRPVAYAGEPTRRDFFEETPSPGAPFLDVHDLRRQAQAYSTPNAYAEGAPVAPRVTDEAETETLEELLRKSRINIQSGKVPTSTEQVKSTFFNEKSRETMNAKATASKLAHGVPLDWPIFKGRGADGRQHMPAYTKGLPPPTGLYNPSAIGLLIQLRDVLHEELPHRLGADRWLLEGQVAMVKELCVPSTAANSIKIYKAIVDDSRSSTGRAS